MFYDIKRHLIQCAATGRIYYECYIGPSKYTSSYQSSTDEALYLINLVQHPPHHFVVAALHPERGQTVARANMPSPFEWPARMDSNRSAITRNGPR